MAFGEVQVTPVGNWSFCPHSSVTGEELDRAIQAHGGAGVSQDTFLASAWAQVRTLRLADGPDEVHIESIAKWELKKWGKSNTQTRPS